MANTPEGKIKNKLDTMLKSLKNSGVWFYSPQSGIYGKSGIPDRVIVVCGSFIGVECKADRTKKPTALQLKCMKDIEMAKGKCFVVYDDKTINQVKTYIEKIIDDSSRTSKSISIKT
jgi:hypothetical protein